MIGPISVLHKFEIDSSHHHLQECSVCHLVHDVTSAPELAFLPFSAPERHTPTSLPLKGHRLPSPPLARAPPITT